MKKKHLFIDSNIWLSLYHFSKNDLDAFKGIKDIIGKNVILYITQQIKNEIARNREFKIKSSFESFEKLDIQFPNFCRCHDKYEGFFKKYEEIKKEHSEWVKEIKIEIANNTLAADLLIEDLFNSSILLNDSEVINDAILRYRTGNPPGKNNSYGDAINWEALLKFIPDESDLYFISDDKDFKSIIEQESFNPFLAQEWNNKKHGIVHFYNNLASFFNDHVKEIKLNDEDDKNELIQGLTKSPNFATTHSLVDKLKMYNEFSELQIRNLCFAFLTNNQIEWIKNDDDIYSFYKRIVSGSEKESDLSELIEIRYNELKDL